MKRFLLSGFLAVALTGLSVNAEPCADWWAVNRDLLGRLGRPQASVAALAQQELAHRPQTAAEAMFKFSVLLRAGLTAEASAAARELRERCPTLDDSQVNNLYYSAGDEFGNWPVARAVVETFAANVRELEVQNRLIRNFEQTGWSVDQIDEWLAARPAGVEGYWAKQRLFYAARHGRAEALVRQLADQARQKPAAPDAVLRFLEVLLAGQQGGLKQFPVDWIPDQVKAGRATDALALGDRLVRLGAPAAALPFFRQATARPLTAEELRQLGSTRQIMIPAKTLAAMFAADAREQLAACLLKLQRPAEAQQWMVEAADIRQRHHLGANTRFAGVVQSQSGQRTMENRIRGEEPKSKDDPAYWRERAQYYRGRNETASEEEALRQALSLTEPKTPPAHPGKGDPDQRAWALTDYAAYLVRQKRAEEAVGLLRHELASAPADAMSTVRAANFLAFELADRLRPDDELVWGWLGARAKWEYTEERVLWRTLERAAVAARDRYFTQAEKLAQGQHPTRAYTLGWVLNRMHAAARSIPLLADATARAGDAEAKERAAFALFESYLDTGDWKRAAEIFPTARRRLTAREVSEWQGRIAVSAGQAGATADALRLWKEVTRLDLTQTSGLTELVRAGLGAELVAWYKDLQRELPTSTAPAAALAILQAK